MSHIHTYEINTDSFSTLNSLSVSLFCYIYDLFYFKSQVFLYKCEISD